WMTRRLLFRTGEREVDGNVGAFGRLTVGEHCVQDVVLGSRDALDQWLRERAPAGKCGRHLVRTIRSTLDVDAQPFHVGSVALSIHVKRTAEELGEWGRVQRIRDDEPVRVKGGKHVGHYPG